MLPPEVRPTKAENQPAPVLNRALALTKRFISRQRYSLAGAAIILVVVLFLFSNRSAWEVSVDNETVGYTLDRDRAMQLAHSILEADGSLEESNAVLDFNRVKRAQVELSTYEELQTRLTCALLKLREGWAIEVNGQAVVTLASKEEAEAVVTEVLNYFPPEVGSELKEVYTTETVESLPCIARTTVFLPVDEAVAYLVRGTKETREYEIRAGDSLWSIARVHDMYVADIEAANPGISENLQIGQKISLVVPKPYVHVVSREEKTVVEAIPFKIDTLKDNSLYTYERKVRTAGKYGSKKVTYDIIRENGQITEQTVIVEQIEQEPTTQVVAVGTKQPVIVATGRYAWPVSRGGQITSRFGQRGGSFHAGVDIGAPQGTPVVASDNGVVTYAGWNGGYGKCVIISHGGSSTLYGHLSQIMVKHGQTVQKGQTVGLVGSTGISSGPHLHFEVREGGSQKNPLLYFKHQ